MELTHILSTLRHHRPQLPEHDEESRDHKKKLQHIDTALSEASAYFYLKTQQVCYRKGNVEIQSRDGWGDNEGVDGENGGDAQCLSQLQVYEHTYK